MALAHLLRGNRDSGKYFLVLTLMSLTNLHVHVCIDIDFYGLAKLGKGRQYLCERGNDLYRMNWVKVVNTPYYISAKLCG